MASSNNIVPDKGISFAIGSWVFITNGSDGFHSQLAEPSRPKPSATTRRNCVDETSLTKMDKNVDMKDGIWGQVVCLNPLVEEKAMEEI